MKYQIFKNLLEKNHLSLKDFADMTELSYSGCYKWKNADVPCWVKSWFILYEENQDLKEIKRLIEKVSNKS